MTTSANQVVIVPASYLLRINSSPIATAYFARDNLDPHIQHAMTFHQLAYNRTRSIHVQSFLNQHPCIKGDQISRKQSVCHKHYTHKYVCT